MFNLAWPLFVFCQKYYVVLSARHVPVVMNHLTEQLLRSHQWSFSPQIFRWLSGSLPTSDPFATTLNLNLSLYVSLVPDPWAPATDALQMNQSGLLLYSFLPKALCHFVVKNLINSQDCRILLVAPVRETKEWLQDQFNRSIGKPLLLPLKEIF